MKTIKLIAVLALAGVATFGLYSALDYDSSLPYEAPTEINQNNTFELINDSKHPVWVSIVNGDTIVAENQEIGAVSAFNEKDVHTEHIDINKPTTLAIYSQKPERGSIKVGLLGGVTFTQNPAIYKFPKSKTIYVTLTPNDDIVPSKPELPGGRNVTRTGFNLDNNVSEQEISAKIPQTMKQIVAEE